MTTFELQEPNMVAISQDSGGCFKMKTSGFWLIFYWASTWALLVVIQHWLNNGLVPNQWHLRLFDTSTRRWVYILFTTYFKRQWYYKPWPTCIILGHWCFLWHWLTWTSETSITQHRLGVRWWKYQMEIWLNTCIFLHTRRFQLKTLKTCF